MHATDPLMQDLNEKNNEIFETLFREHYETLVMHARRYVKDINAARELTTDVFAKLLIRNASFKSVEHAKFVFYLALRQNAINNQDKNKTLLKALKGYIHEKLSPQKYHIELTASEFETEWLEAIYAEIRKLPERQQEILVLHYREELSLKDIARQLNISIRTVWNTKRNAITKIKMILSKRMLLMLLFCFSISL